MNISDYELEQIIAKAFQYAVDDAAELVQNYLEIAIYSSPPGDSYDRFEYNGGFIAAFNEGLIDINGDDMYYQVYDSDNITQQASGIRGKFNHHMSLQKIKGKVDNEYYTVNGRPGAKYYGKKSISEWLIEWYESGTENDVYPEVPALDYFNATFASYGGLDKFLSKKIGEYIVKFIKERMGRW